MTTVPPPQPVPPAQTPKSSGCGKWLLIGCGVIGVLGVIVACIAAFFFFYAIRSTDVYKGARDRAINDSRVVAALGSPVEAGFWVTGKVNIDNSNGVATVKFPISGPKQSAKVDAEATLENGTWAYQKLVVHPSSGPDIDVLHP